MVLALYCCCYCSKRYSVRINWKSIQKTKKNYNKTQYTREKQREIILWTKQDSKKLLEKSTFRSCSFSKCSVLVQCYELLLLPTENLSSFFFYQADMIEFPLKIIIIFAGIIQRFLEFGEFYRLSLKNILHLKTLEHTWRITQWSERIRKRCHVQRDT